MYVGQGWARDLDKVDMPVLQLLLWFSPFFDLPFTFQLAVVVENSALRFKLHGFLLSFSSSPWPSLGPAFKWWSLKRQQRCGAISFLQLLSSFCLLVVALWSLLIDCIMCPELGSNISWRWYLLSVPFKSFLFYVYPPVIYSCSLSPSPLSPPFSLLFSISPSLSPVICSVAVSHSLDFADSIHAVLVFSSSQLPVNWSSSFLRFTFNLGKEEEPLFNRLGGVFFYGDTHFFGGGRWLY